MAEELPQKPFELYDRRASVANRRELVRDVVIEAITSGNKANFIISIVKRSIRYDALSDAEKNVANVMFHVIRVIVRDWSYVSEDDRRKFANGKLVYSTLARRLKEAG